MKTSLFSFVRNATSLGYPIIETVYNLLPIANEVVLVDCGSTDGTRELLESLTINPLIKVGYDTWVNGHGGRNYNKSSSLCNSLCSYDTIIFTEADEVWEESLVDATKLLLNAGHNHMKFWRFQLTQNFQRTSWYLEPDHVLLRVFPKGLYQNLCIDCLTNEDNANIRLAHEVPVSHGYIVDCRNNFRDCYLRREQESKVIYNDTARSSIRIVPAHINYSWEMSPEQATRELQDVRWTWTTTPFRLPKILEWHLGKPTYQVRPELVEAIKNWQPND